jgi:hypothetical protein
MVHITNPPHARREVGIQHKGKKKLTRPLSSARHGARVASAVMDRREPNTATPTLYLAQPNKERSGAHCRLFSYRPLLSLVYNGQ